MIHKLNTSKFWVKIRGPIHLCDCFPQNVILPLTQQSYTYSFFCLLAKWYFKFKTQSYIFSQLNDKLNEIQITFWLCLRLYQNTFQKLFIAKTSIVTVCTIENKIRFFFCYIKVSFKIINWIVIFVLLIF